MSTIRPLERSDLTKVANLLVRTFQGRQEDASPEMADYLGELLLDLPDKDPDIHSFVHEQERPVPASWGSSQHMSLGAETLRAAIGNSLAVDRGAVDPMAGARLCRSFQGPGISRSAIVPTRRPSVFGVAWAAKYCRFTASTGYVLRPTGSSHIHAPTTACACLARIYRSSVGSITLRPIWRIDAAMTFPANRNRRCAPKG